MSYSIGLTLFMSLVERTMAQSSAFFGFYGFVRLLET